MLATIDNQTETGQINQLIIVGLDSNNSRLQDFFEGANTSLSIRYIYRGLTEPSRILPYLRGINTKNTGILVDAKWLDSGNTFVLKAFRLLPEFATIPVIVLGGPHYVPNGTKFLAEGADDFLSGDICAEQVLKRLNFWAKQKKNAIKIETQFDSKLIQPEKIKIHWSKRMLDILLSSTGIILLSPVFLLVALAIRLESKGGAFYFSKRIGAGYKPFKFWKFRSMYVDADARMKELMAANQYGDDAVFVKFANDPRVTKVGKFIRKFSLDELPQLFNILMGDMSVVGNRPLPVYEAEQLINEKAIARFLAPAGLTGLWQVSKRGNAAMSQDERIAIDVKYSRKNNIFFDFLIILKTFTAFIQKEEV